MPLGGGNKANFAVSVLVVVPMDKVLNPGLAASRLAKPLFGHWGQYLRVRNRDSVIAYLNVRL